MTDGQAAKWTSATPSSFHLKHWYPGYFKAVGMGFDSQRCEHSTSVCEGSRRHEEAPPSRFLNCIDDVILPPATRDILQMVEPMLDGFGEQLMGQDLPGGFRQGRTSLAKRGFDPVLAFRPLRRTIQRPSTMSSPSASSSVNTTLATLLRLMLRAGMAKAPMRRLTSLSKASPVKNPPPTKLRIKPRRTMAASIPSAPPSTRPARHQSSRN